MIAHHEAESVSSIILLLLLSLLSSFLLSLLMKQDWSKPRKKVGRPITYNGDPNAPELTEAERRKVKRRIANRESARRVQQRRKEMIDELQHKACTLLRHLYVSPSLYSHLYGLPSLCVRLGQYNSWLLIKLTLKDVVFSFLFSSMRLIDGAEIRIVSAPCHFRVLSW